MIVCHCALPSMKGPDVCKYCPNNVKVEDDFWIHQEPLGYEFDKILHDNLWELMVKNDPEQVDGAKAILAGIK